MSAYNFTTRDASAGRHMRMSMVQLYILTAFRTKYKAVLLNAAHTRYVLGMFGHEVSPFAGAELGGRWESLRAYHTGQRKQSSHLQQETLFVFVAPVFQLWEISCWVQVINFRLSVSEDFDSFG